MKAISSTQTLDTNAVHIQNNLVKDAHLMSLIDTACYQACQTIAPAWPLDRAIAVNPHWSRIGMPVRQVAARMAVLGGIKVFPSRDIVQQAWSKHRISQADLEAALKYVPAASAIGLTQSQCV
jgi:uncharacterized protein